MDTHKTGAEHPYVDLPPSRYWKTGVAQVDASQLDLGWRPKNPITRDTPVITLGSCFAQHISRSLREHGFRWIDSEPAPSGLPQEKHADDGYGVFSFRTGNIYSAALLKQWIYWATGKTQPSDEVFQDATRYFDPFRPNIPADGFDSVEALRAARATTLAAIKKALGEADLLIFTLGLTEAWVNDEGFVYPMCPGTLRGQFSPTRHRFHNYTCDEIVNDLSETFDHLRKLNPRIRFLLTVSPVPLTATATPQHVLVATTYSKSVLRAVAGQLSNARADVDYFPSYELIATPPVRGRHFEANLRSVKAEGVASVMRQFLDGVAAQHAEAPPAEVPRVDEMQSPTQGAKAGVSTEGPGDEICEEIILETWAHSKRVKSSDAGEAPRFLLVGDSQMGMLANAFDELGVRYAGGGIMHATQWHDLRFTPLPHKPFFVPTIEEARPRWDEAVKSFFDAPGHRKDNSWIISNVGTQSRMLFWIGSLAAWIKRVHGFPPDHDFPDGFTISASDVRNFMHYARNHHMALAHRMTSDGYRVLFVQDPPTLPITTALVKSFETVLDESYTAIGCTVFSTRNWTDAMGGFPEEFKSTEIDPTSGKPDWQHGSPEYYRRLAQELLKITGT